MLIARRSFLAGLGASLLVAPAIVRASSLMALRSTKEADLFGLTHYSDAGAERAAATYAELLGFPATEGTLGFVTSGSLPHGLTMGTVYKYRIEPRDRRPKKALGSTWHVAKISNEPTFVIS